MADRYAEILLVDLLGGIGDLIMLLPVVHGLARRYPDAQLRVLTHEPGAELLRGDPTVAQVRVPRHGRPGAESEAVAEALAAHPPDLAVTTTRYGGIPELLEASGARCVTDLWRDPPADEPVGRRYLRILHSEGLLERSDLTASPRVRLRPAELAAGESDVAVRVAGASRPPVVLVPGAGMPVKRWPAHRWEKLADRLTDRGHPVLVTPQGGALPQAIATRRAPSSALGGGLRELAARFAAVGRRGGIVVGGDTGPVRLAAAAGTYTVGLFGPTSAARYGIGGGIDLQGLPDCPHRRPTAITEQVCWWSGDCPLSRTDPACLADLPIDRVLAAVAALTDHADRSADVGAPASYLP